MVSILIKQLIIYQQSMFDASIFLKKMSIVPLAMFYRYIV